MAKVKLLVGLSGPTFSLSPGDEYECADDEAKRLVAADFAVAVAEQKKETAAKRAVKETRGAE